MSPAAATAFKAYRKTEEESIRTPTPTAGPRAAPAGPNREGSVVVLDLDPESSERGTPTPPPPPPPPRPPPATVSRSQPVPEAPRAMEAFLERVLQAVLKIQEEAEQERAAGGDTAAPAAECCEERGDRSGDRDCEAILRRIAGARPPPAPLPPLGWSVVPEDELSVRPLPDSNPEPSRSKLALKLMDFT
eukprot:tig00000227_g19835.t1